MVRRVYADSLALSKQEKANDQRTEKGLSVRQQLPLQSLHLQRWVQVQPLHVQALRLLIMSR
jgi:hypothetical protein